MRWQSRQLAAFAALSNTLLLGAAPTASAQKQEVLETIIVTAQKREENLLDVPVAVNVLSGEALSQEFITEVGDVERLAPSLYITGDNAVVRGIGAVQVGSLQVEPGVAVAVDGVVFGRTSQALIDMIDIERIEVLRGPQGTLYGKNASGGLVNIITRGPAEDLEAEGEIVGIEGEEYLFRGTLSGPLADSTGFRLSAFYRDRAGFHDHALSNDELFAGTSLTLRGKLQFDFGNGSNVRLTAFYRDQESDAPDFQWRDVQSAAIEDVLARVGVVANEESMTTATAGTGFSDKEEWGGQIDANWKFATGHELTSITALADSKDRTLDDVDELPSVIGAPPLYPNPDPLLEGPLVLEQLVATDLRQYSQEFRLTSPDDGPFTYVLGAYGFLLEAGEDTTRRGDSCVLNLAALFGLVPVISPSPAVGEPCVDPNALFTSLSAASVYAPFLFPGTPATVNGAPSLTLSGQDFETETRSYALFGQATYDLSAKLEALLGARVQYDDVEIQQTITIPNPTSFGFGTAAALNTASTDDSGVGGKAALRYELSDDTMVYASYARGYKGPTVSLQGGAPLPVEPEVSNNYEIGLRTTIPGGFFSVTAFRSEYQDFQGEQFDQVQNAFVIANVGEVRTQGVELEALVQLMDNWRVTAAATVLDAEIVDFDEAGCYSPSALDPDCDPLTRTKSLDGANLPLAPDFRVHVGTRYEQAIPDTSFYGFGQLSYTYQDDVQFDVAQNPNTIQEGYGVVDASVGVAAFDGSVQFTVFVRNLLDQNYASALFQSFVVSDSINVLQFRAKEADRTFGAAIRFRF